tara:strand:- start:70 stop:369 length:300 start_codon:yes stop_codon:yes gene_type:complete
MREESCEFNEGKFSITLSGNPGTTVTFFGKFYYEKGNGSLAVRKIDHRTIWLLSLGNLPVGQWVTSDATYDSRAFEVFYNASPIFEQSASSIKWGNYEP